MGIDIELNSEDEAAARSKTQIDALPPDQNSILCIVYAGVLNGQEDETLDPISSQGDFEGLSKRGWRSRGG